MDGTTVHLFPTQPRPLAADLDAAHTVNAWEVDQAAFDKTGTLTLAEPWVGRRHALDDEAAEEVDRGGRDHDSGQGRAVRTADPAVSVVATVRIDRRSGALVAFNAPPGGAQQVTIGFNAINVYDLDIRSNTFRLSAYVWLRWKGDGDPVATLEFPNVVESWDMTKAPLQKAPKQLADGSKDQALHVDAAAAAAHRHADQLVCAVLVLKPTHIEVRTVMPATALLTAVLMRQSAMDAIPECPTLVLMDQIYVLAYVFIVLTLLQIIWASIKIDKESADGIVRIMTIDKRSFVAQIVAFAFLLGLLLLWAEAGSV